MNGKSHGKGKIYNKNGNIIYDGDFVNGLFEGDGKFIYENGEYYIGQWLNGKKHGKGKYIWENGNYYIGQFLNGKRHGKGKIYYKNGDWNGVFINNKYQN